MNTLFNAHCLLDLVVRGNIMSNIYRLISINLINCCFMDFTIIKKKIINYFFYLHS